MGNKTITCAGASAEGGFLFRALVGLCLNVMGDVRLETHQIFSSVVHRLNEEIASAYGLAMTG